MNIMNRNKAKDVQVKLCNSIGEFYEEVKKQKNKNANIFVNEIHGLNRKDKGHFPAESILDTNSTLLK